MTGAVSQRNPGSCVSGVELSGCGKQYSMNALDFGVMVGLSLHSSTDPPVQLFALVNNLLDI